MSAKPLIVAALGARGTGKTAWAKQLREFRGATRLAVWDLMREFGDLPSTDNLGEFVRMLKARTFRVAFHPSRDDRIRAQQFDVWCRALLVAGRLTAHVEELAFVTTPYKAPPHWREMCLLGRHDAHRIAIIGTSQRPAHVDKEFLGNADVVHVGRLVGRGDAQTAAEVLGVTAPEVMQLADLHWLERRAGDTEARRGVLSFTAPERRAPRPSGAKPKGGNLTPG